MSINYGFQKKQRTEVETNLLMVQYSSISGVAKESVGKNIITNFRLEEMARELGEEGEEGVEIIPYYQMDGAGPHQCKKLLTIIDEEFNRRG